MQGKVPPLDLPVPQVNVSRVLVRHDDHICHADSAALSQPLDQWRLLEGPLGAGAQPLTLMTGLLCHSLCSSLGGLLVSQTVCQVAGG